MLAQTAEADNMQRQHMGDLQHNRSIVINGDNLKIAIGGSANLSWRGLYVQNNNAVLLQGNNAFKLFEDAFDALWVSPNDVSGFDNTPSADWEDLGYDNIDARVTFSPHGKSNAKLTEIGKAIAGVKSSLFYSLAFLYETKGAIRNAIEKVADEKTPDVFVYGISDKSVGGLDVQEPNGNPPVAYPEALNGDNLPGPFKEEATGGYGVRLHHKFVVLDFNTPYATVYTGSYNSSIAADTKNAENLFVIKDQRIATSYAVEALAMFDHYAFRDREDEDTKGGNTKNGKKRKSDDDNGDGNDALELQEPPTNGGSAWWAPFWTDATKMRDRELFGQ
ncbi:hypothetical protein EJ03DRAFT_376013 [Teratosphaeria nubilosa]|uniref:Mitochondrial cardiolipin hydrolase n=1 Tax=Teratosphaeria nubilosa TaxID=161662 RepID=A0A6G1L4T6_9PEZI|nr:hypothetical protein EJ03DRAFT_376013 [Teratosphaeria nubilosa]